MSMFIHPVRLTEEAPRQAVCEALAHIERLGINALHMGTDALCNWWHERDASEVERVERGDGELRVAVHAASERGCVLEMLATEEDAPAVTVNGAEATYVVRERSGERWLAIAAPQGRSEVRLHRGH